MAATYTLFGRSQWMASSGSGMIAMTVPNAGGKKITVKSFGIINSTCYNSVIQKINAGYCSAIGVGDLLTPAPMDTSASAWPSTVPCYTQSCVTPTAGALVGSRKVSKSMVFGSAVTTTGWPTMHHTVAQKGKGISTGSVWSRNANSSTDMAVVRAGEKFSVYVDDTFGANQGQGVPLHVSVLLSRDGSPNRTYTLTYYTTSRASNEGIFSIDNNTGSGEVVRIASIDITEVGTSDTPYFQLVPISLVDGASVDDSNRKVTPVKHDTASADFSSSIAQFFFNVPVYPAAGIPWEYCAAGGGGTPKGFNYLHTKDFTGPVFRTELPERVAIRTTNTPTEIGHAYTKHTSMLLQGSSITLRPGEGFALVSGGETATTGLSESGWQTFDFEITVTVENVVSPELTIQGFPTGADVTVLATGTETILQNSEDIAGTSVTYAYSDAHNVDIVVIKPGYIPYAIRNYPLAVAVTAVTLTLSPDPSYLE